MLFGNLLPQMQEPYVFDKKIEGHDTGISCARLHQFILVPFGFKSIKCKNVVPHPFIYTLTQHHSFWKNKFMGKISAVRKREIS